MDICFSSKHRKTKYVEVGRRQAMMVNEHITIGSNSYEKVKNL